MTTRTILATFPLVTDPTLAAQAWATDTDGYRVGLVDLATGDNRDPSGTGPRYTGHNAGLAITEALELAGWLTAVAAELVDDHYLARVLTLIRTPDETGRRLPQLDRIDPELRPEILAGALAGLAGLIEGAR